MYPFCVVTLECGAYVTQLRFVLWSCPSPRHAKSYCNAVANTSAVSAPYQYPASTAGSFLLGDAFPDYCPIPYATVWGLLMCLLYFTHWPTGRDTAAPVAPVWLPTVWHGFWCVFTRCIGLWLILLLYYCSSSRAVVPCPLCLVALPPRVPHHHVVP